MFSGFYDILLTGLRQSFSRALSYRILKQPEHRFFVFFCLAGVSFSSFKLQICTDLSAVSYNNFKR